MNNTEKVKSKGRRAARVRNLKNAIIHSMGKILDMKFINQPLSKEEIENFKKLFGDYVKLTVDVENEWLVVGGELHADAEKLLLEKGSKQDNIWGGGINLTDKQIDTTAVLNLRPRLSNDNLEILHPQTREKFLNIVKNYFGKLWT